MRIRPLHRAQHSTSRRHRRQLLLALICTVPLGACTYSGGELLYVLGFGRGQKVEAQFRLTKEPVLILIDDAAMRIDWPSARIYLFDALAEELLDHKAAARIVPRQTVDGLRQSVDNFEKRGCREIGEMAGARQVLWVEVQDFLAEEEVTEADVAAYFSVSVKVINVLEKERRTRVRLWPPSPQGELVSVSMTGSEVSIAKTKDAISRDLAGRLAVEIAKFFYDHRLGDFERKL
jgi:hypothetical protein